MDACDAMTPMVSIETSTPWSMTGHRERDPARRLAIREVRNRYAIVASLILQGSTIRDIAAYASGTDDATGRPWNVSLRTLQRYQDAAYDLIEKDLERDKDRNLARAVAQRRYLYRVAVDQMNVPAALAVLKDEAELLGVYPDKSNAGSTNIGNINVIAASVQQAIADPRYIAWLEQQAAASPYILDTTASSPAIEPAPPVSQDSDDLPSCDEQDAIAIDHI